MNNKPITTLFLIQSLDGKISTETGDNRDFDKDAKKIGIEEGKKQYDAYEQTTDLHSLNSGKVLAKVGINNAENISKTVVSFMVIDNHHLNLRGVENLCKKSAVFYLITTNKNHPAFSVEAENIKILYYEDKINFKDMFERFKNDYNIDRITVQTGGTLNSIFIRENLIDYISIFIAPVIFGGKDVPTLVDGKNIEIEEDLRLIKNLELINAGKLENSFLHLEYKVCKD